MAKKRPDFREYLLAVSKSWGQLMSGPLSAFWQVVVGVLGFAVVGSLGIAAATAKELEARFVFEGLAFVALLVALYNVWAKERVDYCDLEDKLSPKLNLEFDRADDGCVHLAPMFLGGVERIGDMLMIRVLPSCNAPVVHNVTGVINGIYKLANGAWTKTKYNESLPLSWAIFDTTEPINIVKGKRQYLNVLFVSESKVSIYPVGTNRPPRAADDLNFADTFRVDVLISSAQGDSATASIRIKVGADWKNPEILDLVPQGWPKS